MEHVSHVDSVSSTIAKELGLNDELTKAIAIAHDLGHAPFGHQGEQVIKKISKQYLNQDFWHEKRPGIPTSFVYVVETRRVELRSSED